VIVAVKVLAGAEMRQRQLVGKRAVVGEEAGHPVVGQGWPF
jgi:hypothetical protein